MRKILFIITLTFSILTATNIDTKAQEQAPTYQSLITMGDKEFSNQEYIKAKSYYQEALRIKKDDPTAKSKLNKTLEKIREQSEKEEIFFHINSSLPKYNFRKQSKLENHVSDASVHGINIPIPIAIVNGHSNAVEKLFKRQLPNFLIIFYVNQLNGLA